VGEDGGDGEAAGALDVHEEGAGGWDEGLSFSISTSILHDEVVVTMYLQLMLAGLSLWRGVEEIDCENLIAFISLDSTDSDVE
jgi:hypothetical protein